MLLMIMNVGKIFNGDFGMIYNLVVTNSLCSRPRTLSTLRLPHLVEIHQHRQSTAVSLWQPSGPGDRQATNALARKVEPDSALF